MNSQIFPKMKHLVSNSMKARAPCSAIKFFDNFLLRKTNEVYKFNKNGVTYDAIIGDYYRLNLFHVYYLIYVIFSTVIFAYEFATSESCSIIHTQSKDRRAINRLLKFIFDVFSKEVSLFSYFDIQVICITHKKIKKIITFFIVKSFLMFLSQNVRFFFLSLVFGNV